MVPPNTPTASETRYIDCRCSAFARIYVVNLLFVDSHIQNGDGCSRHTRLTLLIHTDRHFGYGLHNVLTLNNLAKDGVVLLERTGIIRRTNEELAAVGVRTAIGHCKAALNVIQL